MASDFIKLTQQNQSKSQIDALKQIGKPEKYINGSRIVMNGTDLSVFEGDAENFQKQKLGGYSEEQLGLIFNALDVNGDGNLDSKELQAFAAMGTDTEGCIDNDKAIIDETDFQALYEMAQEYVDEALDTSKTDKPSSTTGSSKTDKPSSTDTPKTDKTVIEGSIEKTEEKPKSFGDRVAGFFSGVANGINKVIGGVVNGVGKVVGGVFNGIGSAVKGVVDGVGSAVKGVVGGVGKIVGGVVDGVGSAVKGVVGGVGKVFSGLGNGLKYLVTGHPLKAIGSVVGGVVDGVGSAVKGVVGGIGKVVGGVVNGVSSAVKGVIGGVGKVVGGVVNGAGKVVKGIADGIGSAVKGIADGIGSAVKGFLGIFGI